MILRCPPIFLPVTPRYYRHPSGAAPKGAAGGRGGAPLGGGGAPPPAGKWRRQHCLSVSTELGGLVHYYLDPL